MACLVVSGAGFQEIELHVSCSKPIMSGWIFGSLRLVGFQQVRFFPFDPVNTSTLPFLSLPVSTVHTNWTIFPTMHSVQHSLDIDIARTPIGVHELSKFWLVHLSYPGADFLATGCCASNAAVHAPASVQ